MKITIKLFTFLLSSLLTSLLTCTILLYVISNYNPNLQIKCINDMVYYVDPFRLEIARDTIVRGLFFIQIKQFQRIRKIQLI